jgi:hypothetical protein
VDGQSMKSSSSSRRVDRRPPNEWLEPL